MSHNSVPRWTAEFTAPAPATRVVLIAHKRTDAVPQIVAGLGSDAPPVPPDSLGDLLERACVGRHFVIVGSEALVGSVRAQLLAAGAIDAEMTAVVDDFEQRRVYCTHCRRVTSAAIAVGATVDCAGCGTPLAAYMGYRVDSEELS
jgi:hypothetical protein